MGKNQFMSVNEVALTYGVSQKTIYRRIWAKAIPAFKIGGRGQWKIARVDIEWLRQ
ncbi:MAG: helix-turn-helix domain-containing protein [Proteobacteria bacterium]|nr:helix-turn-helix domain-containing protein [Pseudomonadota bacterium]